jgi:arylformamidase
VTDPFRTRDHVADFDTVVDDYRARSDRTRAAYPALLDVFYGDHADERMDLFFPSNHAGSAPIHLFIHGGYWRANRKEDYAFIAEPVIAAGAIAAIVEYTLMPTARMGHLVNQVRRAEGWLLTNAAGLGGDPSRLTASGHSAGAHLAFYLVAKGPHEGEFPPCGVSRVLLVSGIYDLEPISRSFLQAEISLTGDEIANWSPIAAELRNTTDVRALVGSTETSPFHQQAEELARRHGISVTTLAGLNHMTIVREMGILGTPAANAMLAMLQER